MLAGLREVLDPAYAAGTAVGAFNVICLEHAEALVWGAEAAELPVVLQISENAVLYHRSLEPIVVATVALARNAEVPVVVHLDQATDIELVRAAVKLGVTSVMFDGSRRSYDENVAITADVVRHCSDVGIDVEAELGAVSGQEQTVSPDARTDPRQAAEFVADSGVSALVVAVGGAPAQVERTTSLDLDQVAQLRATLDLPLVLSGASGVPDDELVRGIRAGLTKLNICTHLNARLTRSLRQTLGGQPKLVDPRKYLGPARDCVAEEVERLLRLFALPAPAGSGAEWSTTGAGSVVNQ